MYVYLESPRSPYFSWVETFGVFIAYLYDIMMRYDTGMLPLILHIQDSSERIAFVIQKEDVHCNQDNSFHNA